MAHAGKPWGRGILALKSAHVTSVIARRQVARAAMGLVWAGKVEGCLGCVGTIRPTGVGMLDGQQGRVGQGVGPVFTLSAGKQTHEGTGNWQVLFIAGQGVHMECRPVLLRE